MRKGMTISGAGFLGMLAVSWISILAIGGAWIYSTYVEFRAESYRLREERYQEQRDLVQSEVEQAVEMVARMRHAAVERLQREADLRLEEFSGMVRALVRGAAGRMSGPAAVEAAVKLMAAKDTDQVRLYTVRGDTVYLLAPFPRWLNREPVLDQLERGLEGVDSGRRKVALVVPQGLNSATMALSIERLDNLNLRVVSGAGMEMAEEEVKLAALRALEAVRYGEDGTLFGGTLEGESLIGPAKGRNMWDVTDSGGVKIVQELIAAARRGGGFVTYVMPPLDGRRSAVKVSYAAAIPNWNWYVGTGVFVDDVESIIEARRERLRQLIIRRSLLILAGMGALSLLAFLISHRFGRNIRLNLATFTDVWNQASTGQGEIDTESIDYAEFRELAEAANRMAAERQAAQAALSDSLQRYSSLVSNIPGIVYHSENGPEWEDKFISDSVLDITGYRPEEFLEGGERSFHSIIHPADQEWVARTFREELKHRETYMADYRVIRKDGTIRWLSERGRVMHDALGDPVHLDGVIFDVTDRKQAEEEYYGHVHFLETMERIDKAMHRTSDTQGMLNNTLEAVRQAFGADRAWLLFPCDPEAEELVVPLEQSDPDYAFFTGGNDRLPVSETIRQVLAEALESPVPLAYDGVGGRLLDQAVVEPFTIKSQLVLALHPRVGKPWLFGLHHCRAPRVWAKNEVRLFTEAGRRLADGLSTSLILDELRASEEQFRTFSEQATFGLCMMQDNRTIFANQAFADIFETTVEELKALPSGGFLKYVHPDDRDFFLGQVRRLREGGEGLPKYTWRAVTESGRVKWVEVHARQTRVDGRAADLISLVDVTALKRAGESLEALVAERTRALERKADELRQANAELRKLDQLKSSFLTTVSHAMRTPLTSVLGYVTLVRKDLDRARTGEGAGENLDERMERAARNLDILQTEGLRLRQLIQQFMELTELDATDGLRTETPHPVDAAIRLAVERAGADLDSGCVELALDLDEHLPALTVDPVHLERILAHLLENACCFTREGTIAVRAWSPDGAGLELSVSDTGKGIPEEELEAIFKPFHQVETGDTLVDEIKGAGLGLALCRMLVDKLGGTIRAESGPGRGATFRVSIPG